MIHDRIFINTLKGMRDAYCRDASCDYGLALYFGQPKLKVLGVVKGQIIPKRRFVSEDGGWMLWIFTDWWVKYDGKTIASHATKSKTRLQKICIDIEGQKLIDYSIDKGMETRFDFDLGISIISRDCHKSKLWQISKPSGFFLSVYDDGTFTHDPGTDFDKRKGTARRIGGCTDTR